VVFIGGWGGESVSAAGFEVYPVDVVELCSALVRIPSVNPADNPGTDQVGEERCARWIGDWLRVRFPESLVRVDELLPGRPNVVARLNGERLGGRRVLFAPHTDTVSVVGMTIDPFGGEVRDGRVWGRGASDTKGPMAAMLAGLFAARDVLEQLDFEVWFAGLAGEEAGQHGSRALAVERRFDLVIAAEPTGLDAVCYHKGCAHLRVRTHGRAVHAANPALGENAIIKMGVVMERIRLEVQPWVESHVDSRLGASTLSVGTISGGSKVNIVPDSCEMCLDVRFAPALGADFLEELKARLRGSDSGVEIDLSVGAPLDTDPGHPFVQAFLDIGSRVVGAPWYCDASVFAAAGSPSIAMGCGSIDQAHTKDEFIALEDLRAGARHFESWLRALAG
jgi:acetylornithine deacetylase/succinyl-diaminopimelate desuccinylase-like protein